MAKRTPSTSVSLADGLSGIIPIEDHRFDEEPWPIEFQLPKDLADMWLVYLESECSDRGWRSYGLQQIEFEENSGSITVSTGDGRLSPVLTIVWERPRDGSMYVRAKPAAEPGLSLQDANSFIRRVNERCFARTMQRFYRRGQLHYLGLPWRGELWLNDNLRFGQPSKYATWLIAPQVIIVDAMIDAVDFRHANSEFDLKLRELSIFLSVVMREEFCIPNGGHAWTFTSNQEGKVECELQNLGYWEENPQKEMPPKGNVKAIPLKTVSRPDLTSPGIDTTQNEQSAPDDILDLWDGYSALSSERRKQFLQAGRMWQSALSLSREHETSSVAFMVVACEALKPLAKRYNKWNIHKVVEALLGKGQADELRNLHLRPQGVRDSHLHRGDLVGTELLHRLLVSSYNDPSFHEVRSFLAVTIPAAIIEWLRRCGTI